MKRKEITKGVARNGRYKKTPFWLQPEGCFRLSRSCTSQPCTRVRGFDGEFGPDNVQQMLDSTGLVRFSSPGNVLPAPTAPGAQESCAPGYVRRLSRYVRRSSRYVRRLSRYVRRGHIVTSGGHIVTSGGPILVPPLPMCGHSAPCAGTPPHVRALRGGTSRVESCYGKTFYAICMHGGIDYSG